MLISLTYYLAPRKLHAWDVSSVTASSYYHFCWLVKWVSLSLLSFLYPRESTLNFKWWGWLIGGKNQNPTISLGFPTKPQKILGPKISPKNVHCWISESGIHRHYQESSDWFKYLKNPFLNQATPPPPLRPPKKIHDKISYPKRIPDSKISNPKKILWSSPSPEIQPPLSVFYILRWCDTFLLALWPWD